MPQLRVSLILTLLVLPFSFASVLIFGAYANGNLGDLIQAKSVQTHLQVISPTIVVYSAARENFAVENYYYAYNENLKLNTSQLLDPNVVNTFSALIVGGGGLLASPHVPLAWSNWTSQIKVPVIVLGVGVSCSLIRSPAYEWLSYATLLSARDSVGVACLRERFNRYDAAWIPDPVLADDVNYPFPAVPTAGISPKQRPRICWVISALQKENDFEVMNWIARRLVSSHDLLLNIFPKHSEVRDIPWPAPMRDVLNAEGAWETLRGCECIMSDRLHGCILGVRAGVRTFGFWKSSKHSKVQALYQDVLDLPQLFRVLDTQTTLEEFENWLRVPIDGRHIQRKLENITTTLRSHLRAVLRATNLAPHADIRPFAIKGFFSTFTCLALLIVFVHRSGMLPSGATTEVR